MDTINPTPQESIKLECVEALRGLCASQVRVITAIEELSHPRGSAKTAMRVIAEALEHNEDFIQHAKIALNRTNEELI